MMGGALCVNHAHNLVLTDNSFKHNRASVISPQTTYSQKLFQEGQGGAIYYSCMGEGEYEGNNSCNVSLSGYNEFYNNSAEDEGGAIMFTHYPIVELDPATFINNSAPYGSNYGSYPTHIAWDILIEQSGGRRLQESTGYEIVSGGGFGIVVYLMDALNQNYTADS